MLSAENVICLLVSVTPFSHDGIYALHNKGPDPFFAGGF